MQDQIIVENSSPQVRYRQGAYLGKGGFAKVYEVTDLESLKSFACKIVKQEALLKTKARQKLLQEINIHKTLEHEGVCKYDHYFEDLQNVYIILELCANQSLSQKVKRRGHLTQLEVQCYCLQILHALAYLHKLNIVHRDLKLANLFLDDKMRVKIGDFGLAVQIQTNERRRTMCGTPNYIAPEVLDHEQGHSFEADIWSFGIIVYTLLVGRPPFETQQIKQTYKRIKTGDYSFPDHIEVSDVAKDLVKQILVIDPQQRPSINDILRHEFFRTKVPLSLPKSTLACPPSINFESKFQVYHVPVTVVKWADYTHKVGIGYLLSNNNVGVFFNDRTSLLRDHTQYYHHDTVWTIFKVVPEHLHQKVKIISKFISLFNAEPSVQNEIHVTHYYKSDQFRVFKLSNQTTQFCFNDQSEILICKLTRMVRFNKTHLVNIDEAARDLQFGRRFQIARDFAMQ